MAAALAIALATALATALSAEVALTVAAAMTVQSESPTGLSRRRCASTRRGRRRAIPLRILLMH